MGGLLNNTRKPPVPSNEAHPSFSELTPSPHFWTAPHPNTTTTLALYLLNQRPTRNNEPGLCQLRGALKIDVAEK